MAPWSNFSQDYCGACTQEGETTNQRSMEESENGGQHPGDANRREGVIRTCPASSSDAWATCALQNSTWSAEVSQVSGQHLQHVDLQHWSGYEDKGSAM
jgi:hypothetical protein